MRGQAFVSFESADVAKKALKEVKGFPLYSKPMVRSFFWKTGAPLTFRIQQISFARTRSDAVVKRLDAEHYEEHRQRRLQHKSMYSRLCPIIHVDLNSPLYHPEATRYTNPLKRKFRAQRLAAESGHHFVFFF